MANKIVLVTGYGQTGKDTVGKALKSINPAFSTLSFAEPLKLAANRAMADLGVKINFFNEEDKKQYREVLVAIAKTARAKDKDVFVRAVSKRIQTLIMLGKCPVITDWRYANEYEFISNKFGSSSVMTVMIHKSGTFPASNEEETSIAEIMKSIPVQHSQTFQDGDTAGITKWAETLADLALQDTQSNPSISGGEPKKFESCSQ